MRKTQEQREQQEIYDEIYQLAFERFSNAPNWVTFFREVLGVQGIARSYFPKREQLTEFERSESYHRIQQMLNQLREKEESNLLRREQQKVMTVRLPRALHESLQREADEMRTSVNKLCILKLMRCLEVENEKEP